MPEVSAFDHSITMQDCPFVQTRNYQLMFRGLKFD